MTNQLVSGNQNDNQNDNQIDIETLIGAERAARIWSIFWGGDVGAKSIDRTT
jgi:hypothetical protein